MIAFKRKTKEPCIFRTKLPCLLKVFKHNVRKISLQTDVLQIVIAIIRVVAEFIHHFDLFHNESVVLVSNELFSIVICFCSFSCRLDSSLKPRIDDAHSDNVDGNANNESRDLPLTTILVVIGFLLSL